MNVIFKTIVVGATLTSLLIAARSQADFRDYNYKAWAQVGKARTTQSAGRNRSGMRATSPVIVQSDQSTESVAQAPTDRQSFSYEPSLQPSLGGCPDDAVAGQTPATAEPSVESRRSFSYDSSVPDASSAPRMQNSPAHSTQTPKYLLQKTDPRKYRAN